MDGETEVQGEGREGGTQAPCLQDAQGLDRALGTGVCLLSTYVTLDKLLYLSASFSLNCKVG